MLGSVEVAAVRTTRCAHRKRSLRPSRSIRLRRRRPGSPRRAPPPPSARLASRAAFRSPTSSAPRPEGTSSGASSAQSLDRHVDRTEDGIYALRIRRTRNQWPSSAVRCSARARCRERRARRRLIVSAALAEVRRLSRRRPTSTRHDLLDRPPPRTPIAPPHEMLALLGRELGSAGEGERCERDAGSSSREWVRGRARPCRPSRGSPPSPVSQ